MDCFEIAVGSTVIIFVIAYYIRKYFRKEVEAPKDVDLGFMDDETKV